MPLGGRKHWYLGCDLIFVGSTPGVSKMDLGICALEECVTLVWYQEDLGPSIKGTEVVLGVEWPDVEGGEGESSVSVLSLEALERDCVRPSFSQGVSLQMRWGGYRIPHGLPLQQEKAVGMFKLRTAVVGDSLYKRQLGSIRCSNNVVSNLFLHKWL